MNKTGNFIANLQVGNCRANFLDDTTVITSDNGTLSSKEVNVLPVRGIKGNSDSLNFNIVVTDLGNWSVGN